MSHQICARESEVLAIVRAGQWPDCCDAELQSHVLDCPPCSEAAAVAAAMLADNEAAMKTATVPPSGVVWWRAQRRVRQEATSTAMRAATAVQALTVAAAVVVLTAIVGAAALTIDWSSLVARGSDVVRFTLPFVLVTAACLMLAPVALYFVYRRE